MSSKRSRLKITSAKELAIVTGILEEIRGNTGLTKQWERELKLLSQETRTLKGDSRRVLSVIRQDGTQLLMITKN